MLKLISQVSPAKPNFALQQNSFQKVQPFIFHVDPTLYSGSFIFNQTAQ